MPKAIALVQVQAFYQQMGAVMAQRCDELSAVQGQSKEREAAASKPPGATTSLKAKPMQSKKQQVCTIEEIA